MSMKRAWLTVILLALGLGVAHAQYKYIGSNGEVTYSDIPPPPSARDVQAKNFSSASQAATLPFDLRQATSRFPVTIYTSDACPACDLARTYLKGRGIPYAEKTVTTAEDVDVLKKYVKDPILPYITVGSQKMTSFTEASLGSLLDDAGYPATSKLPQGYINPVAESAAPKPQTPAGATAPTGVSGTAPAPSSPPALPPGNAPPGFKF